MTEQMEAPVAKRMSEKVVMQTIQGTLAATAGTQRRPTATITSATADSTATSETIGTSAGMLAMAEMFFSRWDTSNSSVASNLFNQ